MPGKRWNNCENHSAFTATATERVKQDITASLHLQNPVTVVTLTVRICSSVWSTAMVYLNERLMKIINSVFLLVNIVRLMLSFAPHASAALANKVLALFVLLLVA